MFIRNAWYTAALSAELKPELFARTIANEKVVMYRTSNGGIAALEDRCVHRQVQLSKGRLRNDEVECWYHGMRFNTAGKCVAIPSQQSIPARACVRTFPVAEKYGFVWLWMGDPEKCDEALIPNHWVCSSPDFTGELNYVHADSDYRLALDNFVDVSHVSYVHVSTIVSPALTQATPEIEVNQNEVRVRRIMRSEPSSPLLKMMMKLDHIDRTQEVIFFPIGNTKIETTARPPGQPNGPALRLFSTVIFTPETEKSVHIFAGIHRDFALDNRQLTEHSTKELLTIVLEDRAVTENVQYNWKDDAPTINLGVDRAAIAVRKILDGLLQQETEARTRGAVE